MLTRGRILVIASLTACIIIVAALFIPGWWVGTRKFNFKGFIKETSVDISLSSVYAYVCAEELAVKVCEAAPLWNRIEDFDDIAGVRWVIEGVLCFIATFLGCIMAIILGQSIRKENGENCRSTSNCVGIVGLTHVVIGAIFGVILSIECIILNQKNSYGFETSTPYCLIIFGMGFIIQCVAIGFHIACLRITYIRPRFNEMIFTSSINTPRQMFVHTDTTVAQPYVPLTDVP